MAVTLDREAASALFERLSDELYEKLYDIARDEDDETKLERATNLLAKTPNGVTALVALAMVKSIVEYEGKLTSYESLLRKIAPLDGKGDG